MKEALAAVSLLCFLSGCAGAPVRPALREDLRVPPGTVEGSRFSGIRYPFRVSAPPGWRMATEFPEFLAALGYNRPSPADEERTELYVFNPVTRSNLQIDLTPAGPHATFDADTIRTLTNAATESLRSELDDEYGAERIVLEIAPVRAAPLRGVRYAARKHVNYAVDGKTREQGWIFGFEEPYQIFVIYMILEPSGSNDRADIETIVDSFEFVPDR